MSMEVWAMCLRNHLKRGSSGFSSIRKSRTRPLCGSPDSFGMDGMNKGAPTDMNGSILDAGQNGRRTINGAVQRSDCWRSLLLRPDYCPGDGTWVVLRPAG